MAEERRGLELDFTRKRRGDDSRGFDVLRCVVVAGDRTPHSITSHGALERD
ncbi:hypothetical protein YC2023_118440 [Brassica napus]